MIVETESLHTIAEVAAGLAGFAAVMTGLRVSSSKARERVSSLDRVRLYHMLGSAITVVIFALMPSWIHKLGGVEQDVWFYSTLALITFTALGLVLLFLLSGVQAGKIIYSDWLKGMNVIAVFSFALVFSILASWPIEPNQMSYELILICGLINMTYTFGNMVVERGDTDEVA